ncbi:hypothetical protein [Treponema sp.]|uniref:hypothetical protein n=1 Tax=Treponema sp. TaxID=166 RepID=UPI00298EA890|nr:hypothetical protein [Treponema sp.]MCQ2240627.1 hypothetical protein [Treponema sp.]
MNFFKKMTCAFVVASVFGFAGCKVTETEEIRISELSANIGDEYFQQKAVAKVSDDASVGQDSSVSNIFSSLSGSSTGTMIYSTNSVTGEKIFVTYRGKTPKTYRTGTANTETVVTNLLNYLVEGNSNNLKVNDFASADANVTYFDGTDYWYSTLCTIIISGQTNGKTLSLINGSFNCDVYKKGDSTQKKSVSGSISNVVGIQ